MMETRLTNETRLKKMSLIYSNFSTMSMVLLKRETIFHLHDMTKGKTNFRHISITELAICNYSSSCSYSSSLFPSPVHTFSVHLVNKTIKHLFNKKF